MEQNTFSAQSHFSSTNVWNTRQPSPFSAKNDTYGKNGAKCLVKPLRVARVATRIISQYSKIPENILE